MQIYLELQYDSKELNWARQAQKKKMGEERVVFYGLTKLSIFDLLRK